MSQGIVAYTYVDHQEEIGYPLGLSTRNLEICDAIHFFGSDEENTRLLELERERHPLKDRIVCHTIGRKIHSPSDIASAQNACLSWIRQNQTFDFVLGVQADTMLGGRAIELVLRLARQEHLGHSILLPVDHVRTYAVAHRTRFGCALIGKDSKAEFVEDGGWTRPYEEIPEAQSDPGLYCVDVGYYTPEMYYRHLVRNTKTWQSGPGAILADVFRRDRDEFIRGCLRKVRTYERNNIPLTAIDPSLPEHETIMDYFNCHEDYRHVCELIVELRKVIG